MSESADDPLASYRWKSRVLLIVAPTKDHPLAVAQRAVLADKRAGVADRDLIVYEAVDNSSAAQTLRQQFKLGAEEARAILIGKDGGDKLISREVISALELFREIDSMPMRKGEMRMSQR